MSDFALTTNTFTFTATTEIASTGYDLSEFDGDSRGTARLVDWSDFDDTTTNVQMFDDLVSDLSLGNSWTDVVGFISWADSTFLDAGENGNKYYRDPSSGSNVAYRLRLQNTTSFDLDNSHDNNIISTDPQRRLYVESATGQHKLLVTFDAGNGSAVGDPHVKTFGGGKYTL